MGKKACGVRYRNACCTEIYEDPQDTLRLIVIVPEKLCLQTANLSPSLSRNRQELS